MNWYIVSYYLKLTNLIQYTLIGMYIYISEILNLGLLNNSQVGGYMQYAVWKTTTYKPGLSNTDCKLI